MINLTDNSAYKYAFGVAKGKIKAPKYVKKQARLWLKIADDKDKKYFVCDKQLQKVEALLTIMIMPKGAKARTPMSACLAGYQWFFIVAIMCTVHRNEPTLRKYQSALLEIGRRNGKTLLIAIIFLILLLTEPKYSEFFSVGADGEISRLVMKQMVIIIDSSPTIRDNKFFYCTNNYIKCNLNNSIYTPLNYKNGRFDGREPSAFLADEVSVLPNSEAIESMRTGQTHVRNRLGVLISSKYSKCNNVFDKEVEYCKDVFDGVFKDDKLFALLYDPDEPDMIIKNNSWTKDTNVIYHSNPLALEIPAVLEKIKEDRTKAINKKSARGNFLCKQLNIQCSLNFSETFVDMGILRKCKLNTIDFTGRDVYVGVDMSLTTDNTAVAVSFIENDVVYTMVKIFVPNGQIEHKNKEEKLDYNQFIQDNICVGCGDKTINYTEIENYITSLESELNCHIVQIGFDPYQAQSTMNRLEVSGYDVVKISQNAATLHPTIQYFQDKILNENFRYEQSELLEINFNNVRVHYDGGNRMYFKKQKERGRIDAVMAITNSVYLIYQASLSNDFYFIPQVI